MCGAKEGRLPNVEGVRPTLFSSYRPAYRHQPIDQMKGPGPHRMPRPLNVERWAGYSTRSWMGLVGTTPTDLRPSPAPPATPPYHKKLQKFLFATKGRNLALKLGPRPGRSGCYSSS